MTEWEALVADHKEYKQMVLDILQESPLPLCQEVYTLLVNDDKDKNGFDKGELDLKLRLLSQNVPYNMLIPMLREQIGLTVKSDDECISSLISIKESVNDENQDILDKIIGFMKGEYLENSIIPEIELMGMIDQVPIEKYSILLNCVDYINETSEISQESENSEDY